MSAPRKPIVVVGSINIDLVANAARIPLEGETITGTGFQTHPGGKGANQAVAIGKLGYPVHMIGRTGDDGFGQQLRASLEDAGVDISGVLTSSGTSGVAVILVSARGENCIVITPGANALLQPSDLDKQIETIRSAGMVLTQLEIPLETVAHLAQICGREGVPLMLDPAPAVSLPGELLSNVAWFTPNETEAAFYAGNPAASAEEANPEAVAKALKGKVVSSEAGVILKLGARGVYIDSPQGETGAIAPFHVKVVDTTAAGDCFNGAFATAFMMGKGTMESARFAAAAAAISVTRVGAQPSMPSMAEVLQLLGASA